jgi:hypothetical protein
VLALRALDARTNGGSLRDIATLVLGAQDWPGDGECEKSRTRRMVDLGKSLQAGGPVAILA